MQAPTTCSGADEGSPALRRQETLVRMLPQPNRRPGIESVCSHPGSNPGCHECGKGESPGSEPGRSPVLGPGDPGTPGSLRRDQVFEPIRGLALPCAVRPRWTASQTPGESAGAFI